MGATCGVGSAWCSARREAVRLNGCEEFDRCRRDGTAVSVRLSGALVRELTREKILVEEG